MPDWKRPSESDCGYVEVLTTHNTGAVYGHRLVGAAAGPQVLIAGFCPSAEQVFERILSIPTLPWMRGTLLLVRLELLDDLPEDLSSYSGFGKVDHTVVLPWCESCELDETHIRRCYYMTLRTCADLGMISGRGVPAPLN